MSQGRYSIIMITFDIFLDLRIMILPAQDIIEFLLENAHFKNQGQCISQFPDILSNAHILPNASPQQIKEIAKSFCKQVPF